MAFEQYVAQLGQQARQASSVLMAATTEQKNSALLALANQLHQSTEQLISANKLDLEQAVANGLSDAMIDRLALDAARIDAMAEGVKQVAALQDPIGKITQSRLLPSGIRVAKMQVPLGVVGMIFESRPNVTIDAAVLCLKSGNAAILRGGKEAIHSNMALAAIVGQALQLAGLPAQSVQLIDKLDRDVVSALIGSPDAIDVVIPRGGRGLIERISQDARVPVIKHLDGVCHVYVDKAANQARAIDVAVNAKNQRYGTCNTTETLLVHQDIAPQWLPAWAAQQADYSVEIRACATSKQWLPDAVDAVDSDWVTEYLAPVISVKTVSSLDEAITHINQFGSHHTDAILTDDIGAAEQFKRRVDSGSVMVNASTRFADGFEYGLGAEIGISTDKFHARGPVALEGLCSQKWVVEGDYSIRK